MTPFVTSDASPARGFVLLVACWILAAHPAFAQIISSHRVFGEYQQFIWNDQHGLPQNSVSAATRTRDGYLWLATFEGVVRFDGVRFSVFDTYTTPEITSGLIRALLEDRAGDFWIGIDGGGVVRYSGGRFTHFSSEDGLSDDHVYALLEDRAGNLWIGTDGGGLVRFAGGKFRTYTAKDGLPNDHVWTLEEAPDGALWIGTSGGLARFEHERWTVYRTRDGLPGDLVRSLSFDRHGDLWIGAIGGLARLAGGRFETFDVSTGLTDRRVSVVYHDRDGRLWVGTEGSGAFLRRNDRFLAYRARDGLPGDNVASIYQDPDGDIWIGTDSSGLAQLRNSRFRTYSTTDGVAGEYVASVHGDGANGVWVATDGGLSHLSEGTTRTYRQEQGLPAGMLRTLTRDREDNVWLGARSGLWKWANGRVTHWTTADGLTNNNVYAVLADKAGNIWTATMGGGLVRLRDGQFTSYTTRDGLAHNDLMSLYEDHAGDIWIGTRTGGVSRFKDGRFTTWSTKDGLGSNHVRSFYEDGDGGLWIGTHGGGLSRLKDNRLSTVTARDGLYDDVVFAILDDAAGNLWMSGNRGIYRASLKELTDFVEGRTGSVSSFAYGVADGMLSRECNGGIPGGWKTSDGRLWFPTIKGVVAVDPKRRNENAPLVALETIAIDRQPVPPGMVVRVTPEQHDLEISYTALSWSRPRRVRFKYQMVGIDGTWIDAGSRRTAYYSRLPPGAYTFKVIADNGDGVWNLDGKSLTVVVVPAFYQTAWFRTTAALSAAAMIGLAFHLRVRQLQRAQAAQQAFSAQLIASQEGERKRIAAELHDGLGQSLLIIKNQAVLQRLREPDAATRGAFEELGDLVSQSIDEVRAISWNLRPSHLDQLGLRTALVVMAEKMAAAGGITIDHSIDECDHVLRADDEIMVYRIVQECLNNVVKHARATRVDLTIRRTERSLTIAVRDDGQGFVATAPTPGKGGLGLPGIAERARMLGGTHTIVSTPRAGTSVTIEIPT